MKIMVLLALCYTLSVHAQPTDSFRHIIDSTISKMQQFALHRKEINWQDFRTRVYAQTRGITNLDTLLAQYPLFFEWINDFHGAVATNKQWISWRAGRPRRAPINAMLDSALDNGPRLRIERWGDIGYYRMPAVGGLQDQIPKQTQRLSDSLCRIDPASVKGWIIDLRLNTGGNVWPMLTAIASLIGDGRIGGVRYLDGKPDEITYIQNGNPFGNSQFYSIPDPHCKQPSGNVPVVVLCGPMTGSSGEAVLLAFKGRPNTIVIGEQTAGFITSNNVYGLHPNVTLVLATSYMQDRLGNAYKEGIMPDVTIKDGDNFYQLDQDVKIQRGLAWLKQNIKGK